MLKRQHLNMNIDYKISPSYGHKINQIITDSKISFDQFQTPGWSSMVQTERSQEGKHSVKQSLHSKILQKLNQLQGSLKDTKFLNTKQSDSVVDDIENKNVSKMINNKNDQLKRCNRQNNQQLSSQPVGRESRVLQQRFNNDGKEERSSIRSQQDHKMAPSMSNSNLSQGTNKPNISLIKSKHSQSVNKFNKASSSRFNHITVHEHLYLNSKKLQHKKAMQVIFQEQYQKKIHLPFKPTINPKSQILAQIKYSRIRQKQELQTQLQEQIQSNNQTIKHKKSKSTKPSLQDQKKKRQEDKYKIINSLFYFLSQNQQQITKHTIRDRIQELPFMCLKYIQKLISKLYMGQSFTWLQFIGFVNNKQFITSKQALINIYSKWYNREKEKQQKSKSQLTNNDRKI